MTALRLAGPHDAMVVSAALRALSEAQADDHLASDAMIADSGFGAHPAFQAILAEDGGTVVGIAVFSPFLSTTRGRIGAFVTDLWVAENQRSQGLGSKLLAAVRDAATAQWGSVFLRLMVYQDNPRGAAFYARLGFVGNAMEHWLTLEGDALEELA